MASLSLSPFQLLAVVLAITASFCEVEEVDGRRVPFGDFDYFTLALQWPVTVCHRTRSSNACCRGSNSPTEFTIHGLWPHYDDGTWPAYCRPTKLNEKEISTLLDDLQKYWPSLSCGSSSTRCSGKGSFWAHEWEKHGTCSFPVIRDEYSYFLTALTLYFKYNVTKVLNEAGYVPSNTETYPLGDIISAIQNAFHTTPKLVCSKGAVEELHLCFYKDFKFRDCAASKSSCPIYVSLPAYSSRGLGPDSLLRRKVTEKTRGSKTEQLPFQVPTLCCMCREVQSEIRTLEGQKRQVEIDLDEKVQEADILTSRIKELETQLDKEKEQHKRIALKMKKFIKVHNRHARIQDELKRSQAQLQKFINQLGSDATITGVNEEDSTINVVSDGDTANNHPVSSHNDVLTTSSPKKKKLRGDRITAEELIQEANLIKDRGRWADTDL